MKPAAPAEGEEARGKNGCEAALIYTTFPSLDEAKKAGKALVENGLAACVNIFPEMTSIYIWEGGLEESREAAMLIKTARARSEDVLEQVKRLHPYSLPARLMLAVDGGGEDFLQWILSRTGVRPEA